MTFILKTGSVIVAKTISGYRFVSVLSIDAKKLLDIIAVNEIKIDWVKEAIIEKIENTMSEHRKPRLGDYFFVNISNDDQVDQVIFFFCKKCKNKFLKFDDKEGHNCVQ